MVGAQAKREAASSLEDKYRISERRACKLLTLPRSSKRYDRVPDKDNHNRETIKELASKHKRFGCPRIHILLRRQGIEINHKKTERLYREEGLKLRKKKRRKRITSELRVPLTRAEGPNEEWSLDFVSDSTVYKQRFRCLCIIDNYNREALGIEVSHSISGKYVARVLDKISFTAGLPKSLRVDNGPEFISQALDEWAYRNGVRINFITPGRPMENSYVESFNGKLRDECLNMHWFTDIYDARKKIEDWRNFYNEERPHSSLKGLTPKEFANMNNFMLTG